MDGKSGCFRRLNCVFVLCLLAAHTSSDNTTTFNQTSVKSQDFNMSVTPTATVYVATSILNTSQTTLNVSHNSATPTPETGTKSVGNTTSDKTKDARGPLNVVIIVMIAIFVFIIVVSVSGGLFIMYYKPRSIPRVQLEECESEVDVTSPHHYQRNSIMVMFEHGGNLNAPRYSGDAAALQKVMEAFMGDDGVMGAKPGSKGGLDNIGYDAGCDA